MRWLAVLALCVIEVWVPLVVRSHKERADYSFAVGYDAARTNDREWCASRRELKLPLLYESVDLDSWLEGCLRGADDWAAAAAGAPYSGPGAAGPAGAPR